MYFVTVYWRASGPFWHAFGIPWLCYFAWWAEKMAKQTKSLPISARLKQPSLMQGGQKRRQRGLEARQSTVSFIWYLVMQNMSIILATLTTFTIRGQAENEKNRECVHRQRSLVIQNRMSLLKQYVDEYRETKLSIICNAQHSRRISVHLKYSSI